MPNTSNPRELTGMLTSCDRIYLDGLWRRLFEASTLEERTDVGTLIEQHVARAVTVYFTAELAAFHKARRGS